MTPLKLQIINHYYYSAKEFPDLQAPIVTKTIDWMVDDGVLTQEPPKGREHLNLKYYLTDDSRKWWGTQLDVLGENYSVMIELKRLRKDLEMFQKSSEDELGEHY